MAEPSILRLKVDASGAVTGFAQFDRAAGKTTASARNVESGVRGLGSAIKALAFGAGIRELIQAATGMDRLDSRMRQATGSANAARAEWAFVRSEVARLGLDLEKTTHSYTGFATAARLSGIGASDVRTIFVGVAEAATVMGLRGDEAASALKALEQMASKGTVSAEELRQQLGEKLPGAFSLAAKAMGMTEAALGKAMQKGEIMASELLPKLGAVLHDTFGTQANIAANNLQANLNRISSAWFDLASKAGQAGGMLNQTAAAVANGLQFLADNWGAMEAAIQQTLANTTRTVGKWADFVLGEVEAAARGLAGARDLLGLDFLPSEQKVNARMKGIVDGIANARAGIKQTAEDLASGFDQKAQQALDNVATGVGELADNAGRAAPKVEELSKAAKKLRDHLAEVNFQLRADTMKATSELFSNMNIKAGEASLGKVVTHLQRIHELKMAALTDDQRQAIAIAEILREHEALNLTLEERDALLAQHRDHFEVQIEQASEWGEAMKQANENALRGIQTAFAGFFKKLLTEGKLTWKELGKGLVDVFASVVSELLARWIVLELKKTAETIRQAMIRAAAERTASVAGGSKTGGVSGGTGWGSSLVGAGTSTTSTTGTGVAGTGVSASALAGAAVIAFALYVIYKGFVEKSEQWASVNLSTGVATGNSSRVKDQIRARFDAIYKAIDGITAEFDLQMTKLGDVSLAKRGNTYYVTGANVLSQGFKTGEEAMEYAAVMAIRVGEFADTVSEFMRAIVKGSKAVTMEALRADLEFGKMIEGLGKDDSGRLRDAIQKSNAELDAWWQKLVDMVGHNLGALATGLNNLIGEEVNRWQARFNELAGIRQSPADLLAQRRANLALFYAELDLRVAKLNADKLDLESQRRFLVARMEIVRAGGRLDVEVLRGRGSLLEAEGRLFNGFLQGMGRAITGGVEFLEAALAALDVELAALGKLIEDLGKIPRIDPNTLRPEGRGGNVASDRERLADILRDSERAALSPYALALAELNDRIKEAIRLAHGDAAALAAVNAMRERELALLRQQAERDYAPYLSDYGKAPVGAEVDTFLADLWAIPRAILPDWKKRLIELRFEAEKLGEVMDRLKSFGGDFFPTSAIDDKRKEAAAIGADLAALFARGAIGADAYRVAVENLNGALEYQLKQIEHGIGRDLFGYLKDVPEFAGAAAEFAKMELTAKFEGYRIQLVALGVWEKWAGVFNAALDAGMKAIEGMVNTISDATPEGNARTLREREAQAREDFLKGQADLLEKLRAYTASGIPEGFNREYAELSRLFWEPGKGFLDQAKFYGIALSEVTKAWEGALADLRHRVLAPIRDLRKEMQGAGFTTASPEAQILAALSGSRSEYGKAMGGDLDAYARFAEQAKNLLTLAKEGYGSGTGYGHYYQIVDAMTAMLEQAGIKGSALNAQQSADTQWKTSVLTAMDGQLQAQQRAAAQAHVDAQDQAAILADVAFHLSQMAANDSLASTRPN